jgi:23S rRNA pseudouridine1911/1915/1917 synthase
MLLLDYLQKKYPTAKKMTLKRMLEEGRVRVNGKPADRLKLELGDQDKVEVNERPITQRPRYTLAPLERVHEDADVLVVNKPPGLLTSTVLTEKRQTAIALIRRYLAEREPRARAGIIHRLDRDASGLLVFSKSNGAYEDLKRQFFHHTVERVYTAVVRGKPNPPAGVIRTHLIEMPDGSMRNTDESGKGQVAVTRYETIAVRKGNSLLRVKLETGRKHQIRAHLAKRGVPIAGDEVYGEPAESESRLLLCATMLAFDHPRTGQRMTFQIPPPGEIQKLFPSDVG